MKLTKIFLHAKTACLYYGGDIISLYSCSLEGSAGIDNRLLPGLMQCTMP